MPEMLRQNIPTATEIIRPTATEALDAISNAGGNVHLAAELMGVSQHVLIGAIATDSEVTSVLSQHLRTFAIIRLFEIIQALNLAVIQSIPELAPYDAIKAITAMLQLLNTFTAASPQSSINIHDYVIKMLPPEARGALLELVK